MKKRWRNTEDGEKKNHVRLEGFAPGSSRGHAADRQGKRKLTNAPLTQPANEGPRDPEGPLLHCSVPLTSVSLPLTLTVEPLPETETFDCFGVLPC